MYEVLSTKYQVPSRDRCTKDEVGKIVRRTKYKETRSTRRGGQAKCGTVLGTKYEVLDSKYDGNRVEIPFAAGRRNTEHY
jgi:hypothetical protein